MLRHTEVRDLPAQRTDGKLHAQLLAEAWRPRAAGDHDTGTAISSPSTTTVAGEARAHLVDRTGPHLHAVLLGAAPERRAHRRPSTRAAAGGAAHGRPCRTPAPSSAPLHVIWVAPVACSATPSQADRSVSGIASCKMPQRAAARVGPELGEAARRSDGRPRAPADPAPGRHVSRSRARGSPCWRRGPTGVGPVDQQRARALSPELVRGRGPDHPAPDHHDVEQVHDLPFAGGANRRERSHVSTAPRTRSPGGLQGGADYGSGLIPIERGEETRGEV